ncbi:MAG: ABC transporter permease [Elusimicrobia bacterium]|nr:ABC transporter permease [Elusimicrobiota bacterium]
MPDRLLPPPTAVVAAGAAKAALLWVHGLETLRAVLLGFAGAAVVGIALAVLMTSVWWLEAAIFPLVVVSQTVPKVAIAPLLMIWFGFGIQSKILVTFLIAFFPVLIDTMLGLRSTPVDMILLARSAGAGPVTIFLKFRFPHALPFVFAGLRTAAIFAITGTVVAEFVGGEKGLVYLLLVAQGQYQTGLMFSIVLILSVLGILMLAGVELLERRLIPWHIWMRAGSR